MEALEHLTDVQKEELVHKLMQMDQTQADKAPPTQAIGFKPTPGFCLKTKEKNGSKIFINVCTSDKIPCPADISEEQLMQTIENPQGFPPFRIPMSIGEAHVETDKNGSGCTAYDVVINPSFLTKVNTNALFNGFFLTLALEGTENKYNLQLDRNFIILKNKKYLGPIQDHFVRSSSKPLIMEVDDSGSINVTPTPTKEEVLKKNCETPKYTIIQVPPKGQPEFLVAEIQLPKIRSAQTINLDIGEDRILLTTRSDVYHLDVYLPFNLVQEECGAEFNKLQHILTVTMPVSST